MYSSLNILINGREQPIIPFKDMLFVEAPASGTYEIRLTNRGHYARRLAVVTVDGVNVCDGSPGAHGGPGYIVERDQSITISGWLRTDHEVAAFEFKPRPESYAAYAAKTEQNVGVIGVAWFNEQIPNLWREIPRIKSREASPWWPVRAPWIVPQAPTTAPSDWPPPPQIWCSTGEVGSQLLGAKSEPGDPVAVDVGTAYGAPLERHSTSVEFVRCPQPTLVTSLQYATRERLIAWGVPVPAPDLRRIPQPNPFPAVHVAPPPGWAR